MCSYLKEFSFICEDDIHYHLNGADVITHNLTLKAPSMMSQYAPLISQDIMVAIKSSVDMPKVDNSVSPSAQVEKSTDDEIQIKIKAKEVLFLLYSSKPLDMAKFKDRFINLLLEKNVCFLDNLYPITRVHFSNISYKEFNRLMGEYISNFLIP